MTGNLALVQQHCCDRMQLFTGLSAAEKAALLAKWDGDSGECCICLDAPGADEAVLTRCGHGAMCRPCIAAHLPNQVWLHP